HGNLKTAPQITMLFKCLKALSGIGRQGAQWWREQVTEGFFIAPAYTSPQLMQVAQSKLVRVIDNYRVDIRYVHSTFYNIGTYKYIVLLINEIHNTFFQLMPFQLTMGPSYTQIRAKSFYQC